MDAIKYSIVIPVFQAESTIPVLIPAIEKAMAPVTNTYEIILVNDGSVDQSWQRMKEARSNNSHLKIIDLVGNYGQLAATTCGIEHASGEYILTMDDDLQFSPEDLPALIKHFHSSNYKLIFGVPRERVGSKTLHYNRRIARWLFKNVFLFKYRHVEYFSSLRIMDAELYRRGRLKNIFLIWKLPPGEIGNFAVQHHAGIKQISSYSYGKRVKQFSPYLMLALRDMLLFCASSILLATCISFLLFDSEIYLPLFLFLSFLVGVVFINWKLQQAEEVSFEVREII